jgi:hypothetical protein
MQLKSKGTHTGGEVHCTCSVSFVLSDRAVGKTFSGSFVQFCALPVSGSFMLHPVSMSESEPYLIKLRKL